MFACSFVHCRQTTEHRKKWKKDFMCAFNQATQTFWVFVGSKFFFQTILSLFHWILLLFFSFAFHSYAVSIGLIDLLSRRCMKIREPIEIHQSVVLSILACLGLLTKFADICSKGLYNTYFHQSIIKRSIFWVTLKNTLLMSLF